MDRLRQALAVAMTATVLTMMCAANAWALGALSGSAPVTTSDTAASYVGSASIELMVSDADGVSDIAHTYYILDGTQHEAAGTIVGTHVDAYVTVDGAGSHSFTYWSVDKEGHVENATTVSFDIVGSGGQSDTTPPTTRSNAKTSYAGTATIVLTASDNAGGSGVAHTYYRLDGGAVTEGTTIVVTALGSHSLQFWSKDNAGNTEAPVAISFTVTRPPDAIAPTTSCDALSSYDDSAVIHLSASDNAGGSGVAHTYYRLDAGAATDGTTVSTTSAGSHTLLFWSKDNAGNTEAAHTVTFVVRDTIAPTTSSDATASYSGAAAVVHLVAADNPGGSRVAATYYTVDGGAAATGTTVIVSSEGDHTLRYWSADNAGNVEPAHVADIAVTNVVPDTQAPTTTCDARPSYVGTATIRFTAVDTGWGVAATYHSLDGAAAIAGTSVVVTKVGAHTVRYWSVDYAGNTESTRSATFAVKLVPTSLSIAVSRTVIAVRHRLTMSGVLKPGVQGSKLTVQVRKPRSTRYVTLAGLKASGIASGGVKWAASYVPTLRGVFFFRITFGGDAVRSASVSKIVKVTVR